MTEPSSRRASTRVSRIIKAPRKAVYQAFLDRDAVASWLPPETMTGQVHAFDPREGGKFGMSLTYQDTKHSPGGKTSEDTDTFQGRFVELVPDEKIVWVVEFESQDAGFAGEMRIIWSLADADEGTEVTVLCENIPEGIRPQDNEMGSRSSLQKLAAFLE
jgi:uncharacterized protein YndB with AHSA1/START domain